MHSVYRGLRPLRVTRNVRYKRKNMKSKKLMIVLSLIALTCISFAESLPEQISIKMTVKSEKMVDGKLESRIISTPCAITMIGKVATINMTPELSPELLDEKTEKTPGRPLGYSIRVLDNRGESNFLLKGAFRIRNTPSVQSVEDDGSISVQESCDIKFSLNVCENIPFEFSTADRPDGSKLVFTFLTSRLTQEAANEKVERFIKRANSHSLN